MKKDYKVKVPFRYRQAIKRLPNKKDIVILKQDKGKGVVILNRSKYIEKCLLIVNRSQFLQVDKDPTASIERKVQRTLRKIKDKIPALLYSKIYPTGSSPGLFYGTGKFRKVKGNGNVEDLLLRPIISNIRTATYELAKYLAKILKLLDQSQYAIKRSTSFIKTLKKQMIPPGYQMMSFDIVSLFTNVSLEETINIIIKRIYDKNEINTNIPKQEMKELLYLCTKNAHFTLNSKTYVQVDGVAMGSPLGLVLANIFMVELEQNIIPTLSKDISLWKRYIDDTICFVNSNRISHVLESLNSFHSNIKFTVETKKKETKLHF